MHAVVHVLLRASVLTSDLPYCNAACALNLQPLSPFTPDFSACWNSAVRAPVQYQVCSSHKSTAFQCIIGLLVGGLCSRSRLCSASTAR